MTMTSISEGKKEEFGQVIFDFLETIHGENTFEIRFIPENKYSQPISVIRHDGYIYTNNNKGEKVKVIEANALNMANYLDECLMFAGHTAVCFTVNSPNFDEMKSCETKNSHILNGGNINCQFVDIDAPKEIRHDSTLIKSWKQMIKRKILSFTLRPSIVSETKNGYHVYWLLEDGNHRMFKHIQLQLVNHFDGDEMCVNVSRLLRLPYLLHMKNPKKPFPVKLHIKEPQNKYTQEELKSALPELPEETLQKLSMSTSENASISISSGRRSDILEVLSVEFYSNIVKENDKKISMHCIMPDHPDRNPSAVFFKDSMYYHCSGCGSHYSLLELAKELGWKHVIDTWNRYDLDIESEIEKIKEQMVRVEDLSHLTLDLFEQEQVNIISLKVIDELHSYGQFINAKHQEYIYDIVQILLKANKDKPYLIPLDMGGGKSLIVKIFLQVIMKTNQNFGAIVAVERIEDVKSLAIALNNNVDKEIAYPLYGFDKNECLLNKNGITQHDTCPARKGKSCSFKHKCRYWTQTNDQQDYPIICMTSERLKLQSNDLNKYATFNNLDGSGEEYKRELLIIDEKPRLTYVKTLNLYDFKKYTNKILNELKVFSFEGDLSCYYEFKECVELAEAFYGFDDVGRELFEPINLDFSFSKYFWETFNSIYDFTNDAYSIPNFLESVMRYGGHIDATSAERVTITTSHSLTNRSFNNFKTVIFDGTADIDMEYQHDKYHFFNFEPLRTYEELTFHTCNLINGSKTSMSDVDKINAFCMDVKKIADQNPYEKIFVPVFKDNKGDVISFLNDYIKSEQIIVAHYGSTRGSNKFKDCSIVVLGGILHKTENYYIGKSVALFQQRDDNSLEDISCSKYNQMRRFNDPNIELVKTLDMLIDYSQEIKRSNQRNNSTNVAGKVFVFNNDDILLNLIGQKFPKSKIEEWVPKKMIEHSINSKSNNSVVTAIFEYIKDKIEIYYSDVIVDLGITKQLLSNTMKNPLLRAFLVANNFEIQKEGNKKKIIKGN
jgi:hypothetical protein